MKMPPYLSCLSVTAIVAAASPVAGPQLQSATPAHHLALAILHEPAQRPTAQPGADADRSVELRRRLPSEWDESRVLEQSNGAPQTIARRHREEWFVGATSSGDGRTLDLSFTFLEPNRVYVAHLFEDYPANATERGTRYTAKKVTSTDRLALPLRSGGGVGLWVTPDSKRR